MVSRHLLLQIQAVLLLRSSGWEAVCAAPHTNPLPITAAVRDGATAWSFTLKNIDETTNNGQKKIDNKQTSVMEFGLLFSFEFSHQPV